jgi:hypothetical protein
MEDGSQKGKGSFGKLPKGDFRSYYVTLISQLPLEDVVALSVQGGG